MKNNGDLGPLGPAPVRAGLAGATLSGQRAALLERLQQRDAPATITELAESLGLHGNTVREHLDALVERALVVRTRAPSLGRGRPAWRYAAATDNVEPDPRVRDYAGLATALAGHIERTSADPAADAVEAGRLWGRELATSQAARTGNGPDDPVGTGVEPSAAEAGHLRAPTATAARQQTVEMMRGLGFDPEADPRATTVALRRCPLLDAARRHTAVVCAVHLGIVRGAHEVWGADPERTALLPFAEPGACRLHLLTAEPATAPDDRG